MRHAHPSTSPGAATSGHVLCVAHRAGLRSGRALDSINDVRSSIAEGRMRVSGTVTVERRGYVTTIAIARPDRRNALNASVADEIVAAIDAAELDTQCRAIVLTGVGDRAFCAGGDLQPGADGTPFTIDASDPRHYVVRLLKRMDACRLPLIARVNGAALAGGLGLVCACDLVVAQDKAIFGVTEVKVGLFPMMILPYLLRSIPYKQLMELCLTGEPIDDDNHPGGIRTHGFGGLARRVVCYSTPAPALYGRALGPTSWPVRVAVREQRVQQPDERQERAHPVHIPKTGMRSP